MIPTHDSGKNISIESVAVNEYIFMRNQTTQVYLLEF